MKDVKCTIKSTIRHAGAYYRVEQVVTLEPSLRIEKETYTRQTGALIVTQGYWHWDNITRRLAPSANGGTLGATDWGIYFLLNGSAYLLSHKQKLTAHECVAEAMPHLGVDLQRFIAHIDTLDLHPACKEAVPA